MVHYLFSSYKWISKKTKKSAFILARQSRLALTGPGTNVIFRSPDFSQKGYDFPLLWDTISSIR